jgi:hypothetical protein
MYVFNLRNQSVTIQSRETFVITSSIFSKEIQDGVIYYTCMS